MARSLERKLERKGFAAVSVEGDCISRHFALFTAYLLHHKILTCITFQELRGCGIKRAYRDKPEGLGFR
jgi:hypothetical protein